MAFIDDAYDIDEEYDVITPLRRKQERIYELEDLIHSGNASQDDIDELDDLHEQIDDIAF